jgi:UDP-3-O-[3-hydroxymyristoyl] glucosamine N-acyltransferase
MAVSLKEIAEFLGASLEGDPGLKIENVASLSDAAPGSLSFLANPKYAGQVKDSRASALILGPKDSGLRGTKAALISPNPYRDFARVTSRWRSEEHTSELQSPCVR